MQPCLLVTSCFPVFLVFFPPFVLGSEGQSFALTSPSRPILLRLPQIPGEFISQKQRDLWPVSDVKEWIGWRVWARLTGAPVSLGLGQAGGSTPGNAFPVHTAQPAGRMAEDRLLRTRDRIGPGSQLQPHPT
ncbi:hypothetical protein Pcinc_027571 [Petrolisthes cinctipes]|uniref:Uncharacterized protein n=1 Tax=Petrolisthes cinctipes TaxID=88211 RepID=A0AAE1F3Q9_PETCI|nr:hypothetical protein Pcinc_027571 [Petrolisthes cinctipes]